MAASTATATSRSKTATVNGEQEVVEWICGTDDVGGIETYKDKNGNGFGPGSWGESARYTSINGLILPDFKAKQGSVERWRLIHAGVRDTIGLQFRKARANIRLRAGPTLAAERMPELIASNCTGEPLDFHLVAADGITLASALPTSIATLQPGYRFDALVVFPEAGDYCVIDADTGATIDGAKVGLAAPRNGPGRRRHPAGRAGQGLSGRSARRGGAGPGDAAAGPRRRRRRTCRPTSASAASPLTRPSPSPR